MLKKVFVLIANETYLDHAKSLFYASKSIGKWDGDLCLIANRVSSDLLSDFKRFGVKIIHTNMANFYYVKYCLFDICMKEYDLVIYMDCDFTILGDINNLMIETDSLDSFILADKEHFSIESYLSWNKDGQSIAVLDTEDNTRIAIIEELRAAYDLSRMGFNAGFLAYKTQIIKDRTMIDLIELSNRLQPTNFHTSSMGSDQPVLNLHFINNVMYIADNKISYWKNANENTVAQHHCRWDAPWLNNTYSPRLGKTYYEIYKDNLKTFFDVIKE